MHPIKNSFLLGMLLLALAGCSPAPKSPPPDSLSSQQNIDMAEKLIDAGDFESAYLHLNAALAKEPKNAGLHEQLGWAYLQNGELEKAAGELEALTDLDPTAARTYYLAGALYEALGKSQEALKNYQQAQKEGSAMDRTDQSRLWFDMGEAYHNLKKDEQALKAYENGLTLLKPEEKDRQAWFLFAMCSSQYGLNNQTEAIKTCERALEKTNDETTKSRITDFMQTIKLVQDLEKG